MFSFYCIVGKPSLNLFIPFGINTVLEKSCWCIFLVISQAFLQASWGTFFFFWDKLPLIFMNDHSYSTYVIRLLYLRHMHVPDTALFKSFCCLMHRTQFSLVLQKSNRVWNPDWDIWWPNPSLDILIKSGSSFELNWNQYQCSLFKAEKSLQ